MANLARPKKINEHGWYVAEDVDNGFFADYLHSDGHMYPSMNNAEGKLTGYFPTELEAYKAIYNYMTDER